MNDYEQLNKHELYKLYRLYRIQWSRFELPNKERKFTFSEPLKQPSAYSREDLLMELKMELNRLSMWYQDDPVITMIPDFIRDTFKLYQKINKK